MAVCKRELVYMYLCMFKAWVICILCMNNTCILRLMN